MEIDCRPEHPQISPASTLQPVDRLEGSQNHISRNGNTRALEALPSFELVSHTAPLHVPGWKTWQYVGAGAAFVGGGGALTGAALGLLLRSPGTAAFLALVGAVDGGAVGALLGWAVAPPAERSPRRYDPYGYGYRSNEYYRSNDYYRSNEYYRYRDRFNDGANTPNRLNF